MTSVPISNRDGASIQSVSQWGTRASPGKKRWADDRSAKALAEAWIDGRGPEALVGLFRDQAPQAFGGLRIDGATAEALTAFDSFSGPRNHDLLVGATADRGSFPIGVEGKVNERFGQTLNRYRADADRKQQRGESTNAPKRLSGLLMALGATTLDETPELGRLGYQLFSAVAGTLAAAAEQGASRAAFVVHDLRTPAADADAQAENARDLSSFMTHLFSLEPPPSDHWLLGPARAQNSYGRVRDDIDLWVGHIVTA